MSGKPENLSTGNAICICEASDSSAVGYCNLDQYSIRSRINLGLAEDDASSAVDDEYRWASTPSLKSQGYDDTTSRSSSSHDDVLVDQVVAVGPWHMADWSDILCHLICVISYVYECICSHFWRDIIFGPQ